MEGVLGSIYLLHFDAPLKHATHYMGWVAGVEDSDVERRVSKHRKGRGARLMAVVVEAGITFRVARIWFNVDRNQERRWKARGKARLCPICKEEAKAA